jgi:hypothetical protein
VKMIFDRTTFITGAPRLTQHPTPPGAPRQLSDDHTASRTGYSEWLTVYALVANQV